MSAVSKCKNIKSTIEEAKGYLNYFKDSNVFIENLNQYIDHEEIIDPKQIFQQLERINTSILDFEKNVQITDQQGRIEFDYDSSKLEIDHTISSIVRFKNVYNIPLELDEISTNILLIRDVLRILKESKCKFNPQIKTLSIRQHKKKLITKYLDKKEKLIKWESRETSKNIRGEIQRKHRSNNDFNYTGRINFKQSVLQFYLSCNKIGEKQLTNRDSLSYVHFQKTEIITEIEEIRLKNKTSIILKDEGQLLDFRDKYEFFCKMIKKYKSTVSIIQKFPATIFQSELSVIKEIQSNHAYFEKNVQYFDTDEAIKKLDDLVQLIDNTYIYIYYKKLRDGVQKHTQIFPS